jgi:hypothetical protein
MRLLFLLGLAVSAVGLAAAAPSGAPQLAFPLACQIGRTCEIQRYVDRDPGPGVLDYRCQHRSGPAHDGVDIRLPDMAAQARGVDVLAAAPGKVLRTREGVADVSVKTVGVEAVDAIGCGNAVVIDHGGGWRTGYCHMAKGSVRVKSGDVVAAGQPIGRVGLSGLTEFPHLHFLVRHGDAVVDPFAPDPVAPGACAPQQGLWRPEAARAMAYKAGVILNVGVAGSVVDGPALMAGGIAAPTQASPVIAAYGQVLTPQTGDEIEVTLTGPGGAVLATQRLAPLDHDMADNFRLVGRKRPPTGWPSGVYTADFRIWRAGKVAMEKKAAVTL